MEKDQAELIVIKNALSWYRKNNNTPPQMGDQQLITALKLSGEYWQLIQLFDLIYHDL